MNTEIRLCARALPSQVTWLPARFIHETIARAYEGRYGAGELTSAALLQLQAGEVDVWLTSLKDVGPAQEYACQRFLSEPERVKWQRFLVPHARLQYLVTRALVRTTL